jgi:hypothetical protein
MPNFRWNVKTTVTNKFGSEICVVWYGISWGPHFVGYIKDGEE